MVTFRLCHQPLEVRYQVRTSASQPDNRSTLDTHGKSRTGSSSGLQQPSQVMLLEALQKTLSLPIPAPSGDVPAANTQRRWRRAMENKICARRDMTIQAIA